jgi:hypothetical protein
VVVIRQSELSGNESYLAVGVIRQSELSGYGSYSEIGVIRLWELSGNLKRRNERNQLIGLGFGQSGRRMDSKKIAIWLKP